MRVIEAALDFVTGRKSTEFHSIFGFRPARRGNKKYRRAVLYLLDEKKTQTLRSLEIKDNKDLMKAIRIAEHFGYVPPTYREEYVAAIKEIAKVAPPECIQ